jgi:uncharacterized membrane protein YidH (DUF202 family)
MIAMSVKFRTEHNAKGLGYFFFFLALGIAYTHVYLLVKFMSTEYWIQEKEIFNLLTWFVCIFGVVIGAYTISRWNVTRHNERS